MEKNIKSKEILKPYLIKNSLDKKLQKIEIKDDKVIIGRLADFNDIALEPDPQKFVTRYMHCSIEYKNGMYWLIDNDSKNGTFLKREKVIQKIRGEIKLANKDQILILANLNNEGNPIYWKIEFNDPQATDVAQVSKNEPYVEYDWVQAKLFLINGSSRNEIERLSPQEHKILRYMDQRNKNNNNVPVMCTYEELISSVWDEFRDTRTNNDVNHLRWGLRKKIEVDPENPRFLQNIRGMGYRFINNP